MSGWGKRYLLVTPDGLALPCHVAHTLPGLSFDNVQEHSLDHIWNHSSGFAAASAAKRGCPIRAAAVSGAKSIPVVTAARPFTTPATLQRPIRRAGCPPTTR